MAKVTIDGEVIEAAEGSLILEAAEKLGIPVPTFCYQERLTPLASCRMCLVEIEGQPKLAPACVTRVTEGMVVKTKTDLVEKTRESMLELLLANHPLDCPVCDKAGECELQDTVFAHGAGVSRFRDEKRVFRSRDIALNDVIIFNANRCIQCTRCVRFITEVAGVSEIGLASRGEDAEITTYLEKSLTSEMSGNIIDLCPVGALTSKPYAFNARPWELEPTETIDVMDAVGSNIRVDSRGGRVLRIVPVINDDINEEWISDKTRFVWDGLGRQRLDQPFVRKNGQLMPASWDEALAVVAEKLGGDPQAIAAIAGDLA